MTGQDRPRFVADSMLGSLARWLRMLGCDTVYKKDLEDGELARLASAEKRIVLTRDKDLAKEPGAILIESDDLDSQLKLVSEKCRLSFDEELIRCSTCNGELEEIPKETAKERVPEGAFENNDRFWKCSDCQKVFWHGSHWKGIEKRFRDLNLV